MSKVSVIIPTHSRPHLLPRAVESAFAAGTDVEVIVMTRRDRTAAVCRELSAIKYVRVDRNQGVAGRVTSGSCMPRAYIAFLDDDDLLLPGSWIFRPKPGRHPEIGFVCGGWDGRPEFRPTERSSARRFPATFSFLDGLIFRSWVWLCSCAKSASFAWGSFIDRWMDRLLGKCSCASRNCIGARRSMPVGIYRHLPCGGPGSSLHAPLSYCDSPASKETHEITARR